MITFFKNAYSDEAYYRSIDFALDRIKNGAVKDMVLKIRNGESDKMLLPCVVFSGLLEQGRKDSNLTTHSGFFVLDFDDLTDTNSKKNQLKQDPYIYAAWVSPSGNGVKALVKCLPNIEKHEAMFVAFSERYPDVDMSGKNLSRLCFESYDPDIYINPYAKNFDRTKTQEQALQERQERIQEKSQRPLKTAVAMIQSAPEGERHNTILKAARLAGGYVASGMLDEAETLEALKEAVRNKNFTKSELSIELKAVEDGLGHGMRDPLLEAKKIEKEQEFLVREDGEFDFIASDREMDQYIQSVVDGTLAMGLSSNIPALDKHWMFKFNTLDFFGGVDNVGKSYNVWYLATLQAMFNDIKIVIYSAENGDGEVKKNLMEFYIGKSVKQMSLDELDLAQGFIKNNFKIMTSKKLYTFAELLLRFEVLYEQGFRYDLAVIDPYNSLDVPRGMDEHTHDKKVTNMLRVFKENYATVWVSDHASSSAARNKDADGFVKVPWKSEISGGQIKANKADSFAILHRYISDPARERISEFHVQKIRSKDTGGKPTPFDAPIKFVINDNQCGYTCDGVDPVAEFWGREKPQKRLDGWADMESTNLGDVPF